MKLIKFKYILLLIILMAMVFSMACKTKTSGETKPKLYYTIEGEVKNPAGYGVQNVRVEVANYTMVDSSADKPTDLFATLTDADGAFTLELLAYDDVAKVTLKLTKDGLTTNYINVGVIKGLTVTVTALIAPAGGFQTIDATQDTTVTGTGGATVTISAGTLRDSDGRAASAGRVSVAAIDSTADRTLLPGSLYGMDGSTVKLFSTFGMIEINVIDIDGDPMHLASGATAAVSIPVGDIVGNNPSATVGLWYFNEESATWLLEGNLTLNDAKTAYNGTISHFSLYNAGETWDLSFIKIRVVDQAGDAVYGAEATFFKEMFSDNGVWQESYTTGPEGYVPSILSNELKGIVPDNMAGYLPLPAGAQLNVRIKYIKTSDSKKPVFLFPDPSPDPDGKEAPSIKYEYIVDGEIVDQEDIPAPYTFTTAPAGEITPFGNVAFQLETNAFLTARVQWENGDPVTGHWMRFMTSTAEADQIAVANMDSEGNLLWVKGTTFATGFTYMNDKTLRLPANTAGFMIITTGPPAGGKEYSSWFVNGGGTLENNDDYEGDNGGPNIAKWYTTPDKGVTDTMVITLKGGTSETGPVEVAHTYLAGTAKLANGDPAPEGSWVVFNGMSSGAPVVIRAKVGANGVFPDPTGPFNSTVTVVDGKVTPVKVDSEGQLLAYVEPDWIPVRVNEDGDLETIIGEEWVVLEEDAVFYVELVAGVKYTNTQLLDVTTDPLNPDVLFTYEYEAEGKDVFTPPLSTPDAIGVTLGPNTTVSGRVYYDEGEDGLGKDLLVTFTLVDAVTECVEDEDDPDYDEDCEVDVPVTDITDDTGAYSVNLEVNREYIVTVATHDGDDPLTILKTVLYEGNETEDAANDEFDITIGAEYQPVARVTGTVVYEGAYGEGLFIKFTTTTPSLDTVIAIVGEEEGEYSANLIPATEYSVTVYEDLDGDVLYPSVAYPVTGDELLFTSSDIDSNISDDEDELDIQIGAGMADSFPYSPYLAAGSTGLGGTLMDSAGDPVAVGTSFYLQDAEGGYTFGVVDDDEGTFYAATYVHPNWVSTGEVIALTPGGVYLIGTMGRTINAAFTAGQAGEVLIVRLTDPGDGGTPSNIAYLVGTLMDNAGDPMAVGTSFYLQDAEGGYTFGVVDDDEGNFYAATYVHPNWVSTGDPIALTPGGVYLIGTMGRTINAAFTAGQAGEVQTVNLTDPGDGGTPSNVTYLTGFLTDSRVEGHPVVPVNSAFGIRDAANVATWAIIGNEDGKIFGAVNAGGVYTSTGEPVALTPGGVYRIMFQGVQVIAGYTAGQAGEVQTVLATIPAPE